MAQDPGVPPSLLPPPRLPLLLLMTAARLAACPFAPFPAQLEGENLTSDERNARPNFYADRQENRLREIGGLTDKVNIRQ